MDHKGGGRASAAKLHFLRLPCHSLLVSECTHSCGSTKIVLTLEWAHPCHGLLISYTVLTGLHFPWPVSQRNRANLITGWCCACVCLLSRRRTGFVHTAANGGGWNQRCSSGTNFCVIIFLFPCQFYILPALDFIRKAKIGPTRCCSSIRQLVAPPRFIEKVGKLFG